jgi:hypothetical protein
MILVKIFCTFASSESCKQVYEKINCGRGMELYGENKKIHITDNDDYTHAIILNTAMPPLKIPKQNVLGLAFEPVQFLGMTPEFVQYALQHIGKYLIGDTVHSLPSLFVPHFGYLWHSPPPPLLAEMTMKTRIMSIIVSKKTTAPGHAYRHKLTQEIIKRGLPIDIYGNGSTKYSSFPRVKGPFDDDVQPYRDYLFSICIENFRSGHYFSEKIITPLMHNCLPIYHGCINIHAYFDKEDVITLTGDTERDIPRLIAILINPRMYYRRTCTDKNKKTVNLIENLENLFS